MPTIEALHGLEILDSRGRPTVSATCLLACGATGTASVPSGASTGAAEALELRDGDPARYGGLGCQRAVGHIKGELSAKLVGRMFEDQEAVDLEMIDIDGTANKSRIGANAMLAVSLAFARAAAAQARLPLYQYFAQIAALEPRTMPRPTINLFSGGKHAGQQVPIQDVLVVPALAQTMGEALAMVYAVYQAAEDLVFGKYGMRALTADEGGLAPPFASAEAMLEDAAESIRRAGLQPGKDVSLAVDVASSHFHADSLYQLDEPLNAEGMIERLTQWVDRYPIVSVEDGLAQDDWAHWPSLRRALSGRCLVVGDDFLCTNPDRIRRAIEEDACTALLLKVNQVGTLSESVHALRLARAAEWNVTVSARSGETEDDWLADLAVGWSGQQIKVGSIRQSDRLAKYNRLLAIEDALALPMAAWPNRAVKNVPR
jgi:enolase